MKYLIPLLLFATPAAALDVKCYPFSKVLKQLEQNAKESVVGVGVDNGGKLIVLTKSPSGGWTMLVRLEKGGTVYACPLSGGEGW